MDNKYKFYFMHSTTYNNLLSIIEDEEIRLGDEPVDNERVLSTGHDKVYLNIRFDDLKNINTSPHRYVLLLSAQILKDYDVEVDKGWGHASFMTITKNDPAIDSKIKKIYNFVKKPDLPKMLLSIDFMQHQFLLSQRVNIKKYLIGIVSMHFENSELITIRDKLIEHDLDHITIYSNYPTCDYLINDRNQKEIKIDLSYASNNIYFNEQ